MNGGGTTAGIWSTASHYITNYTSTTLYKQILSESATEGLANFDSHNFINSALFNSTAAVTSLSINYTNLAQYSTATLYGIKNT